MLKRVVKNDKNYETAWLDRLDYEKLTLLSDPRHHQTGANSSALE
jgi:hypothetical protein